MRVFWRCIKCKKLEMLLYAQGHSLKQGVLIVTITYLMEDII